MTLSRITITFVALFYVLIMVCGCTKDNAAASQRWQNTLDEARVQQARNDIVQGHYQRARYLLEPASESCSDYGRQAQLLLDEVDAMPQYTSAQ